MKILLVEDDTTLARATIRILVAKGYEVVVAFDGLSAVALGRKEQPDLVILDIGLPAGGGVSVLERLRSLPATSMVPVIVVSGGIAFEQQMDLESGGVEAILQKPVPPDVLVEAVQAALSDGS
jgi:DNA-binding response OmpR family regulator